MDSYTSSNPVSTFNKGSDAERGVLINLQSKITLIDNNSKVIDVISNVLLANIKVVDKGASGLTSYQQEVLLKHMVSLTMITNTNCHTMHDSLSILTH